MKILKIKSVGIHGQIRKVSGSFFVNFSLIFSSQTNFFSVQVNFEDNLYTTYYVCCKSLFGGYNFLWSKRLKILTIASNTLEGKTAPRRRFQSVRAKRFFITYGLESYADIFDHYFHYYLFIRRKSLILIRLTTLIEVYMGNPTYAPASNSKLRNVRVWSSPEEKKIEELCDYGETG